MRQLFSKLIEIFLVFRSWPFLFTLGASILFAIYIVYLLATLDGLSFFLYSFILSMLWLVAWKIVIKKYTIKRGLFFNIIKYIPFLLLLINTYFLNIAGVWWPRVEFQFRKQQLIEEIKDAKTHGKDLTKIQWKLWRGGLGPLFIYSESPIPTKVDLDYPDYANNHISLDGRDNSRCWGSMFYLGEYFYIYFNECY